jgi:3-isopropylmalate/(R)-2-methylmalate dehydratase small subunit
VKQFKGKVFKYGDNINTDIIIQTQYLSNDRKEMGRHCLQNLDPTFSDKVEQGDILVAGYNFGCGSTKPGALALLGAGIECIVAKSFGRIFFRNAINAGLLVVENPDFVNCIEFGEHAEIDFDKGYCRNVTQNITKYMHPYPPLISDIMRSGGIIQYVNRYGFQ